MSQENIDILNRTPIRRCFNCDSPRSYGNPITQCVGCLHNFCYDHILGGQVRDGEEEIPIRDVCPHCKEKFNYKTL